MKRILFSILIAFLFISKGNTQIKSEAVITNTVNTIESNATDDTTIYLPTDVDIQPEFSGGKPKWNSFLQENFIAPAVPGGLNGKVIVSFIVEKDGSLVDIKILRDLGFGTGDEAVRILKLSPNWTPAELDGKKVRCTFVQTVSIEIPNTPEPTVDNSIYRSDSIEVQPCFPGGMKGWYTLLKNNFRPPDQPGLKGNVIISFIVEKDGSLTDIKVLRDVGYGSGAEAIRVFKLSQNWTPAEHNGEKVRCAFIQTISIETPVN